ncbi:unnamed protein product [Caenorhabditis auriculariae]|uniref:Glycosyltransferase family 92 protein n=1 Tax=Caenorhabditis auriculariae TaxID=2777116 RepID=A0A8S1HHX3_9PELO|nr:unnamed protein product [Caenorhabditis auriculariae]
MQSNGFSLVALLIVSFIIFYFLFVYNSGQNNHTQFSGIIVSDSQNSKKSSGSKKTSLKLTTSSKVLRTPNGCKFEDWNNITTDRIPNHEIHEEWRQKGVSREGNLRANLSVLGAYVYSKYIAVTITSQNLYNTTVFCRYFDCHRKEIENPFKSVVFPESTVYCGRRAGAKFMSLTEKLEDKPQPPVPILDRTQPEPEHFFSICLAPLYGDEPKWMQIVEFIEHYKLQGADHFYVYLFEVNPNDRVILDDYVRTGEIDLIVLHDRFERPDWLVHMVEVFDCLQRSKHHSKWSAFIDIDERMVMKKVGNTVANQLQKVTDPKVGNIEWRVQNVLKTGDSPAKYVNKSQLLSELIFMKYQETMEEQGPGVRQKCIIRPELIGSMWIHRPSSMYPGIKSAPMEARDGIIRHYRNTKKRIFGVGGLGKPINSSRLEPTFEKKLLEAVVERVQSVYDIVPLDCHDIARRVWAGHGLRDPCAVQAEEKKKKEKKEKEGKNA